MDIEIELDHDCNLTGEIVESEIELTLNTPADSVWIGLNIRKAKRLHTWLGKAVEELEKKDD